MSTYIPVMSMSNWCFNCCSTVVPVSS